MNSHKNMLMLSKKMIFHFKEVKNQIEICVTGFYWVAKVNNADL